MATARALNTVIYALMGTHPDVHEVETFSLEELGETVKVCREWHLDRMVVRQGRVKLGSFREPDAPYLAAAAARRAALVAQEARRYAA